MVNSKLCEISRSKKYINNTMNEKREWKQRKKPGKNHCWGINSGALGAIHRTIIIITWYQKGRRRKLSYPTGRCSVVSWRMNHNHEIIIVENFQFSGNFASEAWKPLSPFFILLLIMISCLKFHAVNGTHKGVNTAPPRPRPIAPPDKYTLYRR
jgi:hypothetical protein